jgi:hypothetical protein
MENASRELFRIFVGGPISNAILITAEFDETYYQLYQRSHNSEYIRSDLFCIGESGPLVAIYAFVDPVGSIRQFIYNEAKDLRSYIVTHGDCHVGLNAFLLIREPFEINGADLNRMSEGFLLLTGKMHIASKLQQRLAAKSAAAAG